MSVLLFAAVLAVATIVALRPLASRLGLIDAPSGRKAHAHPTPVTGGIGLLIAMLAAQSLSLIDTPWTLDVAAVLIVVTGAVDDRFDVSWRARMAIQALAMMLLVQFDGLEVTHIGGLFPLYWLALPFTVFAAVGAMNAFNMADGVDGVAGSLALSTLSLLIGAAWYAGDVQLMHVLLSVAGAVLGFLLLNFPLPGRSHAHVFLGDSGSALLGLVIVWASFRLNEHATHPVSGVLAVWMAAIPLIDSLVLIVRRLRQGRSPFSADREHLHHILVDAGFSKSQVAMGMALASLLLGLGAVLAYALGVPESVLLALFLLATVAHYWFSSDRDRALRPFLALSAFTSGR